MNNALQKVYVTGIEVLLGGIISIEKIWRLVMQSHRIPNRPMMPDALIARAALQNNDAAILAKHQLLALAVVESAWKSAGLFAERNRLRGESKKNRHTRFGCVSGTSIGGLAAMEEELQEKARLSPYAMSRWRSNSITAVTTLRYGLGGADLSVNAASATGAQALFMGGTMIRAGLADAMVVVAADPFPTPRILETMTRNGSIAKTEGSMPLSSCRQGIRPVEGASCIILESAEHLIARGGLPIAEWIGGECANEAYHLLAPDDEATVLEEILNRCFIDPNSKKNRSKDEVDWISLHATGTARFDKVEICCLKRFFNKRLPWLTSFKRVSGHPLGASGLIEAAFLCRGIQLGEVPPWPSDTDPVLEIKPANAPRHLAPQLALQIGQGMGGTVVVNIIASVNNVDNMPSLKY